MEKEILWTITLLIHSAVENIHTWSRMVERYFFKINFSKATAAYNKVKRTVTENCES